MMPIRLMAEREPACIPRLRALSDETRWRIARCLVEAGRPLPLTELADRLQISPYNASRHVRILREADIVSVEREGRYKLISVPGRFVARRGGAADPPLLDLGCCRFDLGADGPHATQGEKKQLRNIATEDNRPPTMAGLAHYFMIGGFLGAGKTTAIAELATRLVASGRSVGLITNDQGRELVDTAMLRSRGFATEEIPGGCFCCKFDSLVEAAEQLDRSAAPEIFMAEPVGSCTDLVATVSYPLRRIYGDRYRIAPLSVLVDPHRARRILGLESGASFSDKVLYIYRKQLEEADLIVVSKTDTVADAARDELMETLRVEFPHARLHAISSRTGEGLAEWVEILLSGETAHRPAMNVDYDTYAEGEAQLGWFNATVRVQPQGEIDANVLLEHLAEEVRTRLAEDGALVAHLKMTFSPDRSLAGEVAIVNLVSSEDLPALGQELDEPVEGGQLIVNLRAEAEPSTLESAATEALHAVSSPECRLSIDHLECFRPGRPVPAHRDAG